MRFQIEEYQYYSCNAYHIAFEKNDWDAFTGIVVKMYGQVEFMLVWNGTY